MSRLHLKETPEERAEREWRKARKAERKARRAYDGPPRKRKATRTMEEDLYWGDAAAEGWIPPEASTKIDEDQIRAEVEERIFQEKLFGAMEDDYNHRLDGLEAHFNDYGHIPKRWKAADTNGRDLFASPTADPNELGEEEYAEWIRQGMWRRTHRGEMEERERKKAERRARKEQEAKARSETARLERQREAAREAKREAAEKLRQRAAWGYYETRWKKAHTGSEPQRAPLKFQDIPWPVFSAPLAPADLTPARISAFLFYDIADGAVAPALASRLRRERVREALLRWHPDKFEGRMGARLDGRERDTVMDGVGVVARCLNAMMAT